MASNAEQVDATCNWMDDDRLWRERAAETASVLSSEPVLGILEYRAAAAANIYYALAAEANRRPYRQQTTEAVATARADMLEEAMVADAYRGLLPDATAPQE